MTLEACLPAHLRGPETTITRMAMGFSGAAVYRVDTGGQTFVLKITDQTAPIDGWRRALRIQALAANASIAPQIVHIDEQRRAIVTAFVVDKAFASILYHPPTRDTGAETLEDTPPLGEIYRRMMSGALNVSAPEGRRAFGLALIKEGITRE